jgi:hypothetical protein
LYSAGVLHSCAFGQHFKIQTVCHGDDRINDGCIIPIGKDPPYKDAINFDSVNGKMFQVAQRRIAGSEIVDTQVNAFGLELV